MIFRFLKYFFFLTKAKQLRDVVKDGNEENLEIDLCIGEEKTPSIFWLFEVKTLFVRCTEYVNIFTA